MSRFITFSRTYPSYHPRKGESTHFVEKILRSVLDTDHLAQYYRNMEVLKSIGGYDITKLDLKPIEGFDPKHHTLRAGHRWKAGDWFKPCVWGNDINPKSGRSGPYHSKMIQFAPEIQIKYTLNIDIQPHNKGSYVLLLDGEPARDGLLPIIARNDGLDPVDFNDWFVLSPDFKKKGGFEGQLICWNLNARYFNNVKRDEPYY